VDFRRAKEVGSAATMNPNREELLFGLALTKSVVERSEFLDRECGDDKALRARIEALIAAHERGDQASACKYLAGSEQRAEAR
jgi:hypothetical protein